MKHLLRTSFAIASLTLAPLTPMLLSTPAQAQNQQLQAQQAIHLKFEINPAISGARPWDGTGLNSAQLDNDGGGLFGLGKQVLLDQGNLHMAPPDPYLCIVLDIQKGLECQHGSMQRDTLKYATSLKADAVAGDWFGLVLVDSDQGNLTGGADDLIGYGVVLNEDVLEKVWHGDAAARAIAAKAEQDLTKLVQQRFGTSRSVFGGAAGMLTGAAFSRGGAPNSNSSSNRLDAAKLSVSKCEYGCIFGDGQVFISLTVDGW